MLNLANLKRHAFRSNVNRANYDRRVNKVVPVVVGGDPTRLPLIIVNNRRVYYYIILYYSVTLGCKHTRPAAGLYIIY